MNRLNWSSDSLEICSFCNYSLPSMEHFVSCIIETMMNTVSERMRQNHYCLVDRFLSILTNNRLTIIEKQSLIFRLYMDLDRLSTDWLKIIRESFDNA